MALIDKIKGAFRGMSEKTRLAKEYKDIFDLGGVPSFNEFYYFGIFIWKYIYKGFYSAWHLVPTSTIASPAIGNKPVHKRELFRTGIAKAACAELAKLIWGEGCEINVSLDNSEDDKLQRFVYSVLEDNNFFRKMRESIEQSLALGGGVLKVWGEPGDKNVIKIGYCMADQFVPTAWNNAKITEGVFISRIAKNGYYYTKLEWHKWDGETYVITNDLYKSKTRNNARENQDILGFWCPLAEVYPYLEPKTEITSVSESLFSYFRPASANNIDDNSPLGISIYANALKTLEAIDITYDALVQEIRLGRKRIIVPARAINTIVNPETGQPVRYFDPTDEVYQALMTDDIESLKITDNTVELRIDELVEALNAHLRLFCLQTGFSPNTFSFDLKAGIKTATEVVSENSKTYSTVEDNKAMITPAIKGLVDNIITIARLYNVSFEGEEVNSWFENSGYSVNIAWQDGVVEDRQTIVNRAIQMLANGVMSRKSFMINVMGLTPEQADEELEAIKKENAVNVEAVDDFFSGE